MICYNCDFPSDLLLYVSLCTILILHYSSDFISILQLSIYHYFESFPIILTHCLSFFLLCVYHSSNFLSIILLTFYHSSGSVHHFSVSVSFLYPSIYHSIFHSSDSLSIILLTLYHYSACRRRGGVLNSPRFCFLFFYFFSVSQVGVALMGNTAGTSRVSRPKHGV